MNIHDVHSKNILFIKTLSWIILVLCIAMFFFVAVIAPNTWLYSDIGDRLLRIDQEVNIKVLKEHFKIMTTMVSSCTQSARILCNIILVMYVIIAGMCGVIVWKLRRVSAVQSNNSSV